MFGPDSGKASWDGLNLMFERVRVGSGERRRRRADLLLHVRCKTSLKGIKISLFLPVHAQL